MVGSDENCNRVIQDELKKTPIGGKINAGMVGGQQQRKALSNINRNTIGVTSIHPSVVQKKEGALTITKNTIFDRKPSIPIHRPITRNFAPQMASKKQNPQIQEKKQVQTIPNSSSVLVEVEEGDDAISDDEDYKNTDDYPVPISVNHTEALLEDAEVEMGNPTDEPVMDIDSNDQHNPLAVAEYVGDIYSYYRETELSGCVEPNYMEEQFDINERMRAILIDWLIEVHYKFELMEETLYLTINLIDRFLSLETVVRKKLQLVGITAMLIACKYEEVLVPVVEDLVLISDRGYTRKEILDMERLMIDTLEYNLSVPTPYVFMRRFLKAAESDKKLELLSFFIIELSVVEYEMLKFPPSLLAAAAIFTAQCSIYGCLKWTKTCIKYTKYTKEQLLECAKFMVILHKKSGTGKLTGVYRKYSTYKYGFAAKLSEPALFVMDIATKHPSSSSSSSSSSSLPPPSPSPAPLAEEDDDDDDDE